MDIVENNFQIYIKLLYLLILYLIKIVLKRNQYISSLNALMRQFWGYDKPLNFLPLHHGEKKDFL